jgi:hypothetical protein
MHKKEHNNWILAQYLFKDLGFPLDYREHIAMRKKEFPNLSDLEILEMVRKERDAIGLVK